MKKFALFVFNLSWIYLISITQVSAQDDVGPAATVFVTMFSSLLCVVWPCMYLFFILLALAGVVFWIWTLVDVLQRKPDEIPNQTSWILLIALGGLFGFGLIVSLIYYFTVMRPNPRVK